MPFFNNNQDNITMKILQKGWWNCYIIFVVFAMVACGQKQDPTPGALTETAQTPPFDLLSTYQFFEGNLADLKPKAGILPYDLITPLFSDYAHKARFIYLPADKKIKYHDTEVLEFPVGTILIKNFFYYNDESDTSKGRRIIETRLLIHKENGWEAYPYIWNEAQTEATLQIAGGSTEVKWIDQNQSSRVVNYTIPDRGQCNRCHVMGSTFSPIGPKARNLNRDFAYEGGAKNQLLKMQEMGWLEGLPALDQIETLVKWDDPAQSLELRARAYLDVNCGHCHRRNGRANNSGAFWDYQEKEDRDIGICKHTATAAADAGYVTYEIAPGKPDESMIIFRMESLRPGTMMPELGRSVKHEEGVALIREWILNMKNRGSCSQ